MSFYNSNNNNKNLNANEGFREQSFSGCNEYFNQHSNIGHSLQTQQNFIQSNIYPVNSRTFSNNQGSYSDTHINERGHLEPTQSRHHDHTFKVNILQPPPPPPMFLSHSAHSDNLSKNFAHSHDSHGHLQNRFHPPHYMSTASTHQSSDPNFSATEYPHHCESPKFKSDKSFRSDDYCYNDSSKVSSNRFLEYNKSNAKGDSITMRQENNAYNTAQNYGALCNKRLYQGNDSNEIILTAGDHEKWRNQWMDNIRNRIKNAKKTKLPKAKISDIQKKLLSYGSAILELEHVLAEMVERKSDSGHWHSLFEKSEALIKEINLGRDYFVSSEGNPEVLKCLMDERRSKRRRARNSRKLRLRNKQRMKDEWKRKEEAIDTWMKKVRRLHKEKMDEENVKKEADSVLRGVNVKQEEAETIQKLLNVLSSLRDTRIKKGDSHGYVTFPQADAFFIKFKDEFNSLLNDQMKQYKAEEETLKVMMEESKNCLASSLKSPSITNDVVLRASEAKKRLHQSLFGDTLDLSDQRQAEFFRSFTSAEESIEILIKRRADWDSFLSFENCVDSSLGSSIPIGWVWPPDDVGRNSEWERFRI